MITALCVNNSEERGEPRPRFKVQLTPFSGVAAISGSGCIIRFIPSLSISFNLRGRRRHQKRSSGQKAGHNWIIPQSGNVGKTFHSHFHLHSCSYLKISSQASSYVLDHCPKMSAKLSKKSNSAKTSLLEQSAPVASLWCHFIFPFFVSDTWRFGQNIRI